MSKVNIHDALGHIAKPWQPHTIASINNYDVKAVKLQGAFVWHKHDDTDELFFIVSGKLTIDLRDGQVDLSPGDIYVVPKGVEHRPHADEEVQALLFEPRGVVNTGDAPPSDLTAEERVYTS